MYLNELWKTLQIYKMIEVIHYSCTVYQGLTRSV